MKNTLLALSFVFLLFSCSPTLHVQYQEDHTDFVNPERGFYIPMGTRASNFVPLDSAKLVQLRTKPQTMSKATYSVLSTLIYRGYELDSFKDQPLSPEFLDQLQSDFDIVRKAGIKMILRFAYTNRSHSGDCPDENKICPPYGDAPEQVVLKHVEQLKPLLQKNADVIAVLQEGFIGIWGESYYTDYFGDASQNGVGKMTDSGWKKRNEFLKRLLDALPQTRMIQVRTPQIKQKYLYGPHADVSNAPLTLNNAYSGSDAARLGFHNDCYLSSPDDYGTYYDYGSSTQPRQASLEALRNYISSDTKYTVVGGETCDDTFSPQNDCEPVGRAETEMRMMHYSYLNASYNNDVNNDWDSLGCMKSIKEKLGYRFVMEKAALPKTIHRGKEFTLEADLRNDGYASPYNARPVQLILKNESTGSIFSIELSAKIQKWFSGNIHISEKLQLPANVPTGNYHLFLNLPDGYESLANNPAYSIRLANTHVWQSSTGYNDLRLRITVR
ncbi:MAG: DUF4832 domain-containing protein [Ginsengibacter sp.]